MQVRVDAAQLRAKYRRAGIAEVELCADALMQFERWYSEWANTRPIDATAVVLATFDPELGPSVRLMRLAGLDRGFLFFTDGGSRKASDLSRSARAALCFAWLELARQVRVTGTVEQLSPIEVDTYFRLQPKEAQLIAWASDQRTVEPSREELLRRHGEVSRRFSNSEVPRPESWSGYRLVPDEIEFWQGRVDNLADRIRYRRAAPRGSWLVDRIAP